MQLTNKLLCLLLIGLIGTSCKREDNTQIDYRYQVDSLKSVVSRMQYSKDSLIISLQFERQYSLRLEKERKTTYYNPPVRNDIERRSWFSEYLRAKRDTIKF